MIATSDNSVQEEEPLRQILLHGISWETYERLLDEIGESRLYRLTYADGDLEIMTLSFSHEHWGRWIGRLIFFLAMEFEVEICSGGSTTLRRRLRKKGLEPDECFWIQHEAQMRSKLDWDALHDPPPDLAVEIDISRSSLDRQAIYAALRIPELWRYDGTTLTVLVLGSNGIYKEKAKSPSFSLLPLRQFADFIGKLGSDSEIRLIQQFTKWLRTKVVPKKNRDK
jgi:Uma2 family endonuclease